jgi:hypothetical protein
MGYSLEHATVPDIGAVQWVVADETRIGFLWTKDGQIFARDPEPPHHGTGVDSEEHGVRQLLKDAGLPEDTPKDA